MSTFSHLSPKVGHDEQHKEREPTMLSFSETKCWPCGSLHMLFCITLLIVILPIEKWTERPSNLLEAASEQLCCDRADSRSLLLWQA